MTFHKISLAFLVLILGLSPFTPVSADSADAKFLEIREEYTLKADGSMVKRHEHKLEYLTPYAFSRILGETFIVYNPGHQQLEIVRSVTTMPDGQEVEATPNSFNEVVPGSCRNAPPYMHLREMVVTHLGLDNGSVAHLVYEVRSDPEFYPFLMGEEVFASPHPVEKKIVVVRVPKGTELKHQLLNEEDYSPAEEEEGEYMKYTWELGPLPAPAPDGMSPPLADHAPLLVFSTCPSWKDAAGLLNSRLSGAVWLNEAATEKARALRRESNTGVEFVRAVNRFVVEEVAGAPVNMEHVGYRPRKAGEVYDDSVGSDLDRMVLLVAMLRHEGYFAQPVFVSRHRAVAEEVPSWSQFVECRVICSLRDRLDKPLFLENLLFLSPTRLVSSVFEDGLAGRTIFRPSLMNNQLHKVPPSGEPVNRVKTDLTLELCDDHKLGGSMSLEVTGVLNPYIRLVEDAHAGAKGLLRNLIPDAELDAIEPYLLSEERSMFRAKTKSGVALEKGEGYDFLMWEVPDAPGGVASLHIPFASAKRTNALWLPRTVVEDTDVAIALPESVEVVGMPVQKQINNAAGSLVCGAWVEEGMLYIKRSLVLGKQLIAPEEYPALRELMVEWAASDTKRVVFKPKADS